MKEQTSWGRVSAEAKEHIALPRSGMLGSPQIVIRGQKLLYPVLTSSSQPGIAARNGLSLLSVASAVLTQGVEWHCKSYYGYSVSSNDLPMGWICWLLCVHGMGQNGQNKTWDWGQY